MKAVQERKSLCHSTTGDIHVVSKVLLTILPVQLVL